MENVEFAMVPLYAEDGTVFTLVVTKGGSQPLSTDEIAECLMTYSLKLLDDEEELAN